MQVVLDQRKAREDRLLSELAELRREEAVEVSRLRQLRRELAEASVSMESAHIGNVEARELERRDEHLKAKRDDVRLQEMTLEAVRARLETKRIEVVDAMKDRKVMESLRDRQEHEYLVGAARAEQAVLDDMASLRCARST